MPFIIKRRALLAGLGTLALPRCGRAAIHPGHPRLFLRREPWGPRGLTLAEARRRGAAFAPALLSEPLRSCEGAPDFAMHYLVTGEEESARQAVERMKRGISGGEWTTTQGDEIEAIATAYDWLAGAWPGFPREDRAAVEEILVREGSAAMRNLGRGASMYHTRMYAWANGALFAGLALTGERPEAAGLADFGIRYWRERLMPSRAHLEGAWFNALSYGKKYMCRSVFSFLTAWRSATGEDLWAAARESGNPWPETMLFYLMYMLRPDHRFATYGDIFDSMWRSDQGTRRVVAQAVSETRHAFGQGFLEELEAQHGRKAYDRGSRWYQVFEDGAIPGRRRAELPLSRLFSPKALGAVVMRSGWGAEDTWVLFKCGDYGDNHGHFDQGHFEIFRRGQLALDSFYGAKDTRYHNTILVNDPEDPADVGMQRIFSRQVHRSPESYLADPIVRTGRMLHFSHTPRATRALGDATLAYPPTRVKSFTRQVVFLDRKLVVIYDVVTAAEARFRRRFRLHYPATPAIEGQAFRWSNNGGQLTVRTLLPAKASIKDFPHPPEYRPSGSLATFREFGPKGYVEVEPAEYDSPVTYFLHVLAPQGAGDAAPEAQLREEADAWVVRVSGAELAFAKSGREPCVVR